MSVIRTVAELSQDPEFAGYYDLEEKHRQQIEDAKETGYDEGIHEGVKQASLDNAKNLLKLNVLSEEQIAEATNLSLDEIQALQKGI